MNRIKSIVLVGHENSGSSYLLRTILDSFPDVTFTLVVTTGLYYRRTFTSSLWKLVRESSLLFCAMRFAELVRYRTAGRTMQRECKRRSVAVLTTADINSPSTIAELKGLNPDLLVSLYTMHIYRAEVLSVGRFGAIGSHPSILPNYRGLEVFFWAMANNEDTTGVSVFTLKPKIDAGEVIRQETMAIRPKQTMHEVYQMITESAGRLLVAAIRDIEEGTATYRTPQGEGSYYPMPTREAVRRFRRLGKRFYKWF
jgi:folate-dependent phosphoribosylglycinamide formyltransferase PurN